LRAAVQDASTTRVVPERSRQIFGQLTGSKLVRRRGRIARSDRLGSPDYALPSAVCPRRHAQVRQPWSVYILLRAAPDAAAVPFWLQIAAVVLAPVMGMLGVTAGAVLRTRTERRAYLREERRKAYVAFAHEFGALVSGVGTFATSAARTAATEQDASAVSRYLDHLRSSMSSIEKLRHEIDLIGSRRAADAATNAYYVIAAVSARLAVATQGEVDADAWQRLLGQGMPVQVAFLSAAQSDLGLPKGDRMKEAKTSASLSDETVGYARGVIRQATQAEPAGKSED
jgi:hypothetical protein